MGEQDQGGGDTSKENLRLSYSNDYFGFVVYGSAHNNEQITDNREPTYGGKKVLKLQIELILEAIELKERVKLLAEL